MIHTTPLAAHKVEPRRPAAPDLRLADEAFGTGAAASGWWILPAALGGIAVWGFVIRALLF